MSKFIGIFLGKFLAYLNSWTGHFVLSLVLFLVSFKLVLSLFDYVKAKTELRTKVAKPFMFKVKEKLLGKDNDAFTNASIEIIDITKTDKSRVIVPIITFIIEFPVLFGLFFVLYNPISVLYGRDAYDVAALGEVAQTVVEGGISQEMNIVNAVAMKPEAFAEFDVAAIAAIDPVLFGINLFEPAKMGTVSLIFPLLLIGVQVFNIVKLIMEVVQKKKTWKQQSIGLGLFTFAAVVMMTAAFRLPMAFYLYFIVFGGIGMVSNKIANALVKKQLPKARAANAACQEVLKKYNIEDFVSAFQDEVDAHNEEVEKDTENGLTEEKEEGEETETQT